MILRGESKRGQVTIFVMIAILIVIGILVYSFAIKANLDSKNTPSVGFERCVSKALDGAIEELAVTGGYQGDYMSLKYLNNEVPYFCYTGVNLELCSVQTPSPKKVFEESLKEKVLPEIKNCYDTSIISLKLQGYEVEKGEIETTLTLKSNSVQVDVEAPTNVEGSTFEEFSYEFNSNIYDVLILDTEILNIKISFG